MGRRGHHEYRLVWVWGLAFDIGNGSRKQIPIPNVMDVLTVGASRRLAYPLVIIRYTDLVNIHRNYFRAILKNLLESSILGNLGNT